MKTLEDILENERFQLLVESKSLPAAFWSLLTGLTALIGLIIKFSGFESHIAQWLLDAVRTDNTTHASHLKGWAEAAIFLILVIFAAFGILLLWNLKRHFARSADRILLDRHMSDVAQIVSQANKTTGKIWQEITVRYLINKDYSGTFWWDASIQADKVPVNFVESRAYVEEKADGASNFDALDFRVTSATSGTRCVYLPTKNKRRAKKACIFFLPAIEPGTSRKYQVWYKWPGMFKALKRNGQEPFEYDVTNLDQFAVLRFEVYLQEGMQRSLSCKYTGNWLQYSEVQQGHQEQGWSGNGYAYTFQNAQGPFSFTFLVELKP